MKFRLKELMALRERETGQPCTYEVISEATNINANTLSAIGTNKIKRFPVEALDGLLNFFECGPADLIIHVKKPKENAQ